MHPRVIYFINFVAVAVIAVFWLTDVIGTLVFAALLLAEASLTIWLAVLFMRREREQVNAFQDLFRAINEQRTAGERSSTNGNDPT